MENPGGPQRALAFVGRAGREAEAASHEERAARRGKPQRRGAARQRDERAERSTLRRAPPVEDEPRTQPRLAPRLRVRRRRRDEARPTGELLGREPRGRRPGRELGRRHLALLARPRAEVDAVEDL